MQPVLLMTSVVPGFVWVNGRPAGEVAPDAPAVRPVGPQGAVYLQHFPILPGYLPLSRRLTFSGGRVMAGSVENVNGLWAVAWPGGAVEVELTPERVSPAPEAPFSPLEKPGAVRLEDGTVKALEPLGDTVGHVRLNSWRLEPEGWQVFHSEILWSQGGPRWPVTPQETALAMAEACLLGLTDEARAYLSPLARVPDLEGVSACVPMRYPSPDGRAAVGLVRAKGPNFAWVEPMYYRATPAGGPQGTWRLDDISVESVGAY